MATMNVPSFSEADQELLRSSRFLQEPTQQAILDVYFSGAAGSEETVYNLLEEIKQRAPKVEAELSQRAHEEAQRAREEREMAENLTKETPTILRPGTQASTTAQAAASEDSDEPAAAAQLPDMLIEVPDTPAQAGDDSDWETGPPTEHVFESDDL